MRKFLKQLRKGLRTACVTAALATCWNVGQSVAHAGYTSGEEVRLQFTGTVSPAENDLSHVFLIFCTGASSWQSDYQAVELGSFEVSHEGTFSFEADAIYQEYELYCVVAGLYGDLSSGQYVEGVNGVTLNARYNSQNPNYDSWNNFVFCSESQLFDYLLNGDMTNLANGIWSFYRFGSGAMEGTISGDLYDFSDPTLNGTYEINSEIIPEPITIMLLGSGGMFVLCRRRKNESGD